MDMVNVLPNRILVIAIRAIGDVVLITPVLRLLKERYPSAHLAVVADGVSAQILHHNPHVNKVFLTDRSSSRKLSIVNKLREWMKFSSELQHEQFDTVIDLYSGPRSALMTWMTKAKDRYGEDYRSRLRGYLYNHPIQVCRDGRHLVEQKLELITPLVEKSNQGNVSLELLVMSEEQEKARELLSPVKASNTRYACLIPGAGSQWRVWPSERYAQLANQLVEKYQAQVVLVGSIQEQAVCAEIQKMMKAKPLDLSGKTTLRELSAVLAEMDLVISNVTGPMHIASAHAKPKVIGLYGEADIVQYSPWSRNAMVLTKGKLEEAYWHDVDYERDYQKLLEITVDDIVQTVHEVMDEWKV
ncbi:MAG: lipopolysaccharide heptosyltransferase II [Nitrospirales bacterium]